MGQKPNDATEEGVQIKLSKEEYALGMVQRSKYVAVQDVLT